jgi:G3E family GTPase
VTKTDLLNPDDGRLPALISSIRSLNPSAKLIEVDQADIPADIVDIGLFNPKTKSLDVQRWLGRADGLASTVNAPSPAHHHAHDHSSEHDPSHDHDHQISSFSLIHDQPVPFAILEGFLDLLRASQGSHLLRVKGIICLAEEPDQPIVIHGVQQVMHPPVTLPAWPTDDHRSRLIFITHNCPKNVVERLFGAFTGGVSPDTADADALQNNPLAISGFTSN